jgi:nucleotide-binding universal stress UspA family protein
MFDRILVPVDLGNDPASAKCLYVAAELAAQFGSALHVLTVVPDVGYAVVAQYFPADAEARIAEDAAAQLSDFVKEHLPSGMSAHEMVAQGPVYDEILSVADEVKADLIVIGAHRPDLRDYLLGSNASRVVRHARVSVFVVRM